MQLNNENLPTLSDIEFICKATFGMLKIPIYFISYERKILFEFCSKSLKSPFNPDKHLLLLQLVDENTSLNPVHIKSTAYLENFISLKIKGMDGIGGTIIIGPSVSIRITPKGIDGLISDFNIPIKYKAELSSYFEQLTVMDYENFVDLALLLYYSFTHEHLEFENITRNKDDIQNTEHQSNYALETYSIGRLQYGIFHHSQKSEQELLQCISEGNIDGLSEYLKKPLDGTPGVHSKNPLRNQKNLFISTVPKISTAAVEGGMDWEAALSLSDYYIQCVEELTDIKDILNLLCQMYYDYTYRVQAHKCQSQSKIIAKCKDYIDNHLYEEIYLSQLSENVAMNLCYLSHIFKKETGISISEYIQIRKMHEAKKLLVSPGNKLTDVYVMLGFHDQSYFTRVFKKVTGFTPREYRSLNISTD